MKWKWSVKFLQWAEPSITFPAHRPSSLNSCSSLSLRKPTWSPISPFPCSLPLAELPQCPTLPSQKGPLPHKASPHVFPLDLIHLNIPSNTTNSGIFLCSETLISIFWSKTCFPSSGTKMDTKMFISPSSEEIKQKSRERRQVWLTGLCIRKGSSLSCREEVSR